MKQTFGKLLLRLITGNFSNINTDEINKANAVFILSTGRTGTNFLGKSLDNIPYIKSVHEPKPSWRLRMWSGAMLENDASKDELEKVFRKFRLHTYKKDKNIYVESNPFLFGFSEVIDKIYINAKLVYIIRDPREYIKSAINHGNSTGIKAIVNKILPYWIADVGEVYKKREIESFIEKLAAYWLLINEHLLRSVNNKSIIVRFEDIFFNDREMKKVLKFIGLKDADLDEIIRKSATNKSKKSEIAGWKNWDPYLCFKIDDICGKLMRQFNYGNEDEWIKKVNNGQKFEKVSK